MGYALSSAQASSGPTWSGPTQHMPVSTHNPVSTSQRTVNPSHQVVSPFHGSLTSQHGATSLPLIGPLPVRHTLSGHESSNLQHFLIPTHASPAPSIALDLSSSAATITLGSGLFEKSETVTIYVGASKQSFHSGSIVTAAEYVAIKQVLAQGNQSLTLSADGKAVGGSFSLNAVASGPIGELLVPQGVQAFDNVSSSRGLAISGELINYGTIYGYSSNGRELIATLRAQEIVNESGGIISTQLPNGQSPKTAHQGNLSLNLLSATDLVNSGQIVSSGNLDLNAGGSIANTTGSLSVPLLQAVNSVYMTSGSGKVINDGTVSATTGSINLMAGKNAQAFIIEAPNGNFQAASGNINVAAQNKTNNINFNGGNYYSQNLDINSGKGNITGVVGEVTGILNTTGNANHFLADTPTLYLGTNKIAGDPTYLNMRGDIVIDGAVTASEDITILASGNITASGDAYISTANSVGVATAPSTDVTLVAGANIVLNGMGTGGANSASANISSIAVLNGTQTVSVFTNSSTGGNIDLTGSTHVGPVIDTSSTLSFGGTNQPNGGSVVLAANANAFGNLGGQILLNTSGTSINTSSLNSAGGNITLIAGSNPIPPGITVQTGDLIASGGQQAGSVGIYTAPVATSNNKAITFSTTGSVTSGNSLTFQVVSSSPNISQQASVVVGNIVAAGGSGQTGTGGAFDQSGGMGGQGGAGGSITINAGKNITTGNLYSFGGGGGGGGAGGAYDTGGISGGGGGGGGNGGTISVTGAGILQINGGVNTSGGGGGGGGGSGQGNLIVQPAPGSPGNGGYAGAISIFNDLATTITGTAFAANGGAGGGGGVSTSANGGSGGGGGASYGAGGGGGGGAQVYGGGGAGGGGIYGGGGGGSAANQSGLVSGSGGSGGGALAGGAGGAAGSSGTAGGNGLTGSGGTGPIGVGGTGSDAAGGSMGNPGGGGNSGNTAGAGAVLTLSVFFSGDVSVAGSGLVLASDMIGRTVLLNGFGNSNVTLGGNVTSSKDTTISTSGTGVILQASGTVITAGGAVDLTANTNLGTASQPVQINTAQVQLTTIKTSDVFIDDSAPSVTLSNNIVANNFSFTASNATGASLILGAGVTITGTTQAILSSTGTISQADAKGLITAPSVTLTASKGGIGVFGQTMEIKAPAIAISAAGQVIIDDSVGNLTVTGNNSALALFLTDNASSGSNITFAGSFASLTSLAISNSLGSLSFSSTSTINLANVSLAAAGNLDLGGLLAYNSPCHPKRRPICRGCGRQYPGYRCGSSCLHRQ